MKKFSLLFLAAGLWFNMHAQTNDATIAYIQQYKQIAIDEMIRTGVPASITLAQGIQESGAGQSELTQESNNHFGIKCKSDWTGDVVYHDDDTKHECFRKYNSGEESYHDHSDFLKNRDNYAFLFDIDPTDYKDWAYGLKKAGYATERDYAPSLIALIERYDLEQYTDVALQQSKQLSPVAITAVPAKAQNDYAFENPVSQNDENKTSVINDDNAINYPEGIFSINNTKVVFAKEGTSLFALATNYGIDYNKLLSYNDLDKADILTHSSLIYLEKKPKRGTKDFHIAEPNENMHDIAQEEGIQLGSLLTYNNLSKNQQLKAGDKILLHGESKKIF